jgi:hypothetical protein
MTQRDELLAKLDVVRRERTQAVLEAMAGGREHFRDIVELRNLLDECREFICKQ